MTKKFSTTYDIWDNNPFEVHKSAGAIRYFEESPYGLLYMDIKNYHVEDAFVTTVEDKIYNHSVAYYSRAKRVRDLQDKIGKPIMTEFIKIVENNLLINCPVIKDDINVAEYIWAPNLVSLKGKTAIKKPTQVRDYVIPIPLSIFQKYRQITLCADAMKVKNIPFFLSISKHLYFRNVEFVEGKKADNFMISMNNINTLY